MRQVAVIAVDQVKQPGIAIDQPPVLAGIKILDDDGLGLTLFFRFRGGCFVGQAHSEGRQHDAGAAFAFRTYLQLTEVFVQGFSLARDSGLGIVAVLEVVEASDASVRMFVTGFIPGFDLELEPVVDAVELGPLLLFTAQRRQIDRLGQALFVFQTKRELPLILRLLFGLAASLFIFFNSYMLRFANDALVAAAIKRHARFDHELVIFPADLQPTHDSPADRHAVDEAALVVEITLFLQQITNGELLAVVIIVSLVRWRLTYAAMRSRFRLHNSFLSSFYFNLAWFARVRSSGSFRSRRPSRAAKYPVFWRWRNRRPGE